MYCLVLIISGFVVEYFTVLCSGIVMSAQSAVKNPCNTFQHVLALF